MFSNLDFKTRIRASVICVYQDKLLVFKGIDPTSNREYWFLPGGALEVGETFVEASERETLEETGYRVRVLPETEVVRRYPFHWNGVDYDCTTHFFRADLVSDFSAPAAVDDAKYNKGAHWLPLAEIENSLAYTLEIRDAVLKVVLQLTE